MASLSVLMSLYVKEKTEYVRACFESLLRQTVTADEWVIVEDGPLSDDMYALLNEYKEKYPGLIKSVPLNRNQGLGLALREGIPECKNELIARMDTDDIARKDRFEKQLAEFDKNPNLDICGSQVDEFKDDPTIIVAHRVVPISDYEIKKYQKRRDAFNHMSVMYKKSAVLRAGNYESCPLMEDTYLWVRMILSGANCLNIDEPLVFVRIGNGMFGRRGGWSYFKKYKLGREQVYKTGYIGLGDYLFTLVIQFFVAIMPNCVREQIYINLLHKRI